MKEIQPSFNTLSRDIYDDIFSYMPLFPDVSTLARLNKKFYDIVKTSRLWRKFSLQYQVLLTGKTTNLKPNDNETAWLLTSNTHPPVNVAFTRFAEDEETCVDRYICPLYQNSVADLFPEPIIMLSHPFMNSDVIQELDLTGIAEPERVLSFIVSSNKFSNLQKLSVALFNGSLPDSADVDLVFEEDEIEEEEDFSDLETKTTKAKPAPKKKKRAKKRASDYTIMTSENLTVFPQLTHLNLLGHTMLTSMEFVKIVPCFPALKYLVLTCCEHLSQPTAITKSLAAHCPRLETIAVDITPIPVTALLCIQSLKLVFTSQQFKPKRQYPLKLVRTDPLSLIRRKESEKFPQFQELLSFIAQPQLPDLSGGTLLTYACGEKHPSIDHIRLLLSLPGVDVNYLCNTRPVLPDQLFNPWIPHFPWNPNRDEENMIGPGLSCLHQLMSHPGLKSGQVSELVTLLLQHGANPYLIGSEDSMSPLATAVFRQAFHVADELMNSIPVSCDLNGETVIHYVCKCFDGGNAMEFFALINSALKRGYDINKQATLGYTALLYAAAKNHLELVKYLFEKGAKVINCDYLHQFLWGNCSNVEILELLYQNGLDLQYQVRGKSPLVLQTYSGIDTAVQLWYLSKDQGRQVVKQKAKEPILHCIFEQGSVNEEIYELVKSLLEAGADPNELDMNNNTPIMTLCVHCEHEKATKKKKDQKKRASPKKGASPASGSTRLTPSEEHENGQSLFEKTLQLLISHGADVNATNSFGRSVAHDEGSAIDLETVEVLPGFGVDYTLRDKKNVTPLLLFAWTHKVEAILTLLRKGVKPEQHHHPAGLTLLHALAHVPKHRAEELKEVVERTVASGIDINHRDDSGYTALHYAIESRNEILCEILLDMGADVAIQTKLGHNAIMLALLPGYKYLYSTTEFDYKKPRVGKRVSRQQLDSSLFEKMVKSSPTSVAAVDIRNRSALHHLASQFNHAIAELILSHSTKEMINQQDQDGNTPLHCALLRRKEFFKQKVCRNCEDEYDEDEDEEYNGYEEKETASVSETINSFVTQLIQRGANLNIQNNSSLTTHLYAKFCGSDLIWKDDFFAVMTAEEWKIQDNEGDTVLHILARVGNLDVCSETVLQLADCSILNNCGRSALHEACYVPQKELLILLKSPTAKLNQAETLSGRTALSILIQQYIVHPKHKTALAIQFLMDHTDAQNTEVTKLATPDLLHRIRNSTKTVHKEEEEEEEKQDEPEFINIMKPIRRKYKDADAKKKSPRSKKTAKAVSAKAAAKWLKESKESKESSDNDEYY